LLPAAVDIAIVPVTVAFPPGAIGVDGTLVALNVTTLASHEDPVVTDPGVVTVAVPPVALCSTTDAFVLLLLTFTVTPVTESPG
jgi:hypothetical protein